ncbi:hypothetical protein AAKU55_003635 [Oxalobacteraceae bacterium GrIS 1.11]
MIIVHLYGSLTQQLGQYAFGLECATRLATVLKLDGGTVATPALLDYFSVQSALADGAEVAAAKAAGSLTEDTLLFDPAVWQRLRDGIYLDGIWHDFGYSAAALPGLTAGMGLRAPPGDAARALLASISLQPDAAALDLRAAAPPQGLAALPDEYYRDALAALAYRKPQAHLFVFCDDPALAARRFDFGPHHTLVGPIDAALALLLMAACQHQIVTYHGASCWAARLTPKPGQLVLAPQQAFDPADPALLARFGAVTQPLWPAHWQVLPIRACHAPIDYLRADGGRNPGPVIRVALWNYYEELTTDGFLFRNANASIGHDLLKPWVELHAYGLAHGIDFVTYDQVDGVADLDAVLFMDRPRPGNPAVQALLASGIAKYLLLYECEVIKPDNWDADYHRQFDRIFTWNDALVDGERYLKINFAIDPESRYELATQQSAFAQRKLATIIAGAKQSAHPYELYSHRLRTIRWFESGAAADFDLYGGGWDPAQFPSYRGKVDDKLATLAAYRFAICYENAKNIPGYITEKILDCLRAGTVPVYGGAPNIARWIPPDCYIDIAAFATYDDLYAHLRDMDSATHGAYLARMHAFLASPQAYPFSTECFIVTLSGFIAWDVQSRRGAIPELAARKGAPAGARLLQDGATLALRVDATPAPVAAAPPPPDLVVYIGYGDELPVYTRARALWQFYRSYFPDIEIVFVRETADLARGQVVTDGDDLLVGLGAEHFRGDTSYAATGTWSATENSRVIFRQMVVYDHLLRTRERPFFLYHTTVTSVVDLRALQQLLSKMPATGCFAGPLSRLTAPEQFNGWTFVSGASTLLSRDVVVLLRNRYDPAHPHASLPNDVWQALTLHDVPRLALPTFNFIKPRAVGEQLNAVSGLAGRMLRDGQFHFRIKTTSFEEGLGKREDIDPWIMLKIMEEIIGHAAALPATLALCGKYGRFVDGGAGQPLPPYTRGDFFSGPRDFPVNDQEVH